MADATHFPIVEYRTHPTIQGSGFIWEGKRSIDLRWVAAAAPFAYGSTLVTVCGASHGEPIDCEYTDFMRDWCRAKGIA